MRAVASAIWSAHRAATGRSQRDMQAHHARPCGEHLRPLPSPSQAFRGDFVLSRWSGGEGRPFLRQGCALVASGVPTGCETHPAPPKPGPSDIRPLQNSSSPPPPPGPSPRTPVAPCVAGQVSPSPSSGLGATCGPVLILRGVGRRQGCSDRAPGQDSLL